MTQSPVTLEYSPRPPAIWRRRWARRAIVVVLLVVLGVIASRHRAAIKSRARQLYWARQCSRFTAAPDTPRVAVDASQLASLPNKQDYFLEIRGSRGASTQPVYRFLPNCWVQFALLARARPYHFFEPQTVFLHELRTPSGKRRIVHVESVGENMYRPAAHLVPTIIEPPTLLSPPRIIWETSGAYAISEAFEPARLRIGQPDPNDQAHFTIEFESVEQWAGQTFPKRSGIIDARLGEDDRITFRVRDPASTQRR